MFKTINPVLIVLTLAFSITGSTAQADAGWKNFFRCSDDITQITIQVPKTRAGFYDGASELRARGTQAGWGQAMDSGWVTVKQTMRDGRLTFSSDEAWPVFYAEINPAGRTMSSFRFNDLGSSWGVSATGRVLKCEFFAHMSL